MIYFLKILITSCGARNSIKCWKVQKWRRRWPVPGGAVHSYRRTGAQASGVDAKTAKSPLFPRRRSWGIGSVFLGVTSAWVSKDEPPFSRQTEHTADSRETKKTLVTSTEVWVSAAHRGRRRFRNDFGLKGPGLVEWEKAKCEWKCFYS